MTSSEIDYRKQAVSALLKENPTIIGRDAAQVLGISESAFRRYKKKLFEEKTGVLSNIQTNRYRRAYEDLKAHTRKLEAALEAKDTELQSYAAISDTPKISKINVSDKTKTEVVPVIVASDWHIEETVTSAITNGLNEYNLDIAEDSIKQFFSKACDMVEDTKSTHTVNTVVLAILGDIINGVLRNEDLESNQVTSIDAITLARSLIYSGIKMMHQRIGCDLRVLCCVGNHGRMTEKIHYSNQIHQSLEYLLYKTLERDFRDVPGIKFHVSESYYVIQPIFGVRVRFHHGHSIKFHGGIGGIAVPVLRKMAQMNTIEEADLDVIGHFHSSQMFNNVIVNGSLVGSNGFSMSLGLPHDIPKQTYFEIDSKYGRTTVRPICIDREVKKNIIEAI